MLLKVVEKFSTTFFFYFDKKDINKKIEDIKN
jgi:hypothetical protein